MKLIYGHYRSLEEYLPRFISENKKNAVDKILIVTPSSRGARALQGALTRALGVTSNISFIKFSSLPARVDKEFSPSAPPVLSRAPLQDFILKNIAAAREGVVKRGYITALKSTLRDLSDALVDAAVVKDHAAQGAFGSKEDNEYMSSLADIYEKYYSALSAVPGYRSYADFFAAAAENIPNSLWLKSFKKIIFYGFYDFTGTQLEIFNAARQNFDTALFFPYLNHPAYKYAEKLFNTNILGLTKDVTSLEDSGKTALDGAQAALFNPLEAARGNPAAQIISASGARGELFAAAKTIIDLVENKGYKFEDIAVTARGLENYKDYIFDVFEENKIPLNASIDFPLTAHPLAVFCFNLLNLARGGFEKGTVQAVISSPYFKIKNNWKFIIKNSLAERGLSQWENLLSGGKYDADFLNWLKEINAELAFLNKPYPWDILAGHALKILAAYTNTEIFNEREKNIFAQFSSLIEEFKQFSLVRGAAAGGEFLEELQNVLSSAVLSRAQNSELGVTAGGIMSLRGQNFKVVIALGLNEKVFPAPAREDPLLRDAYRRVLRDVQGFWISQKLERFDEEKLLFFFAVTAAREKLFLSFQRSDEEGKASSPSLYLAELCRAAGIDFEKNTRGYPRRELEKYLSVDDKLLNKKEISVKISALADIEQNYKTAGFDFAAVKGGFAAAAQIASRGALTAYDGVLDNGAEIYDALSSKSFSASGMQILAQCPQRFYNSRVLGLEDEQETLKRSELASNLKGLLYHKILQRVYGEISGPLTVEGVLAKLENIVQEELRADRYKEYGLYPVAWKVITAKMKEYLTVFLTKDIESLDGFVPKYFETEITARANYGGGEINLRGFIDRVDVKDGAYRIIDYKTAQSSVKDLTKAAFAKKYTQPFIYPLMTSQAAEFKDKKFESFSFLNIEKGYFRRELTAEDFAELEEKFGGLIKLVLSFTKYGKFFIKESDNYCPYCSFANICRKGVGAALTRARASNFYKELESYDE
ncbi:MAG: exodeoxyribonuclease V subunit gamma [Elusimicrobium sp.]|jgi:ATP-dependent helicase/DNAse subunit B|nr:exodeoxyribonuclease V subunit gamma [Elusimicrobium sp.]